MVFLFQIFNFIAKFKSDFYINSPFLYVSFALILQIYSLIFYALGLLRCNLAKVKKGIILN
jgi:hypothetical protein